MSESTIYDAIIIGGGAAGFFAAINIKLNKRNSRVAILEKSTKTLAKVKVSGGGRCNVTHACFSSAQLSKNYPRGEKFLKKVFKEFAVNETIQWFEQHGVQLKTEADGRMFPVSDSSLSIINCLQQLRQKLGIELITSCAVEQVVKGADTFILKTKNNQINSKKVLIASGGSTTSKGFDWIRKLGHHIAEPVPSLFTFNIADKALHELAGLSVANAYIKIEGEKMAYSGACLITHWGLSGPAVLKLSAWGARLLAEKNYQFKIHVNWNNYYSEEEYRLAISRYREQHPKQKIINSPLFGLAARLWEFLLMKSEINNQKIWADCSKKEINRLIENVFRCVFEISSKTTFKEEFVTCGGVSLSEVDSQNLQSRQVGGLYFAGEVLDMDGITGGFNFQAAWSTAYLAAKDIASRL